MDFTTEHFKFFPFIFISEENNRDHFISLIASGVDKKRIHKLISNTIRTKDNGIFVISKL
jgi:hypothetical protein